MKKRILSFLLALIMVLGLCPIPSFADNSEIKVVVSMEGLTLGQGMYFKPKAYTLSQINALVNGTYTKEELTAGIATEAFLLDNNVDYEMTGSWDSDAYLSGVKVIDTREINIPSIISEKGGPSNDVNDGNNDDYLGQFDYSNMSGWMLTVNDFMIDVGCGQWRFMDSANAEKYKSNPGKDTYVVRWQFTVSGYGADLGVGGNFGQNPYFTAANKAPLYAAYAEATDTTKKTAALPIMEKLTATQEEVNLALATLTQTTVSNKTVTVNVIPKTVNVTFKSGETTLTDSEVKDNGDVKVSNKTFHQYVLTVPAGEYSYVGTESGINLGGESFTVADTEDAQTMNLLRANIRYNGASLNQKEDYTFTLKNGEKDVILGDSYLSSSIRYTPTLLIAGVAHSGTVTLDSKWNDEFYVTDSGNFTNTPSTTATSAANINLPISQYKIIRVTAPKNAQTTFYTQEKNYLVKKVTPDITTENQANGTVTYMFKGTAAHSNYQFRSMMNGKVTQAGYLKDGDNIVVDFDRDRNSDATMSYDDGSVLLNINEKNKLNLATGKTFKLRAYRAAWQIINTTTGNIMIEPDFHYQILSGNDVISIQSTDVSSKGEPYCNGNATGNWMNVTANKSGTAVVAVYYDPIDVFGANPANASGYTQFKATDPSRYGIFVVKVDDDGTITWNGASHDGDWDAEFDTVYYSGEQGTFTFKPTESVTKVTVQNVNGLTLGEVKDVNASADGSFAVPVTSGANIITASVDGKTDTMVIRAKKIGYKIINNTTGESKENGAPAIKTGDSVTIHLDKLDMPIPKFSGIYNPGYMSTAKNAYVLNDVATIMSTGTQYDFANSAKSDITFTAHFAGINSLKGYISLSSMGSDFGEHRNVDDNGMPANLNAAEKFGDFGELPAIEFEVTDSEEKDSYDDATAITSLTVKGANSTGYLTGFANWTKAENGSSNWTADTATVATYAITANVKTKDYNNTLVLRCWYDGEEVKTIPLSSGVTATVSDFKLNADKILNLQVEIAPLDNALCAAKTYTYIVYPGKSNLQYIHPVIKSLTAKAGDQKLTITPAVDTATLSYTLDVDGNDNITLEGEQLTKIYNTAVTADKSDKVVLTKLKNGETIGDPVTILKGVEPTNPNRDWKLSNLDIIGADTLQIKVTSYVNDAKERTYSINLKNTKKATAPTAYKTILDATLSQLVKTVTEPKFGTNAGEWTVLALARGGADVPEGYFEGYYERVEAALPTLEQKALSGSKKTGALDKNKSTENSRLIMALSAIGRDSTKVGGVNVLGAYDSNGFDWIVKQGINGPIFALIALDTKDYPTTDTTLRQQCVAHILSKELAGGGWALSGSTMSVDVTAMALQALVNYQDNPDVVAAANRAFAVLSEAQAEDGNFTYGGAASSESNAQVIVALSAWGIDADEDYRFVKNNHSALEALLSYYIEDSKGFAHVMETDNGYIGGEVNGMATDQAAYALVAYDRFKSGKKALYDMSDVKLESEAPIEQTDPNPTYIKPQINQKTAQAEIPENIEVKPNEPLIFRAVTENDVDKAIISIPAAVMKNIGKAEKLELQTNVGTIVFDKDALGQMAEESNVSIAMSAGEKAEDGSVTFTLTAVDSDGKDVFTKDSSGSATIAVEFDPPKSGNEIHVYYVNKTERNRVPSSFENGKLIFVVNHFSDYQAIEEKADINAAASIILPDKIENKGGTTFKAIVTLDAFPEGNRLIDGIITIPDGIKVKSVEMGPYIKGGAVSFYTEENTGKMRFTYADVINGTILTLDERETPTILMTITFELENTLENNINIAVTGLSFKMNSYSQATIVDTSKASGTVLLKGENDDDEESISLKVSELYRGDGIDIIPENKKAIVVSASGIAKGKKLVYKEGSDEIVFKYNEEVSEKTGISTYFALIDAEKNLQSFTDLTKYTVGAGTSEAFTFGDTNSDGQIDAQDALNAVNFWLRKVSPTDDQILSSNVNGDSRLNTFDALGIVEKFVDHREFSIVTKAAIAKAN